MTSISIDGLSLSNHDYALISSHPQGSTPGNFRAVLTDGPKVSMCTKQNVFSFVQTSIRHVLL